MLTPPHPRILVRATNWVGDAVMSLPALQKIRERFPESHIAVLARPWVADIYARESFAGEVIPYTSPRGFHDLAGKWRVAQDLRSRRFDIAILLQNAFEAAALVWAAGIPRRIGYDRDGRGWLLTDRIPPPRAGEIPRHEQYYYLELLKRAGLLDKLPDSATIRLSGSSGAAQRGIVSLRAAGLETPVIGISPGAAYGTAKRWLPERFAEAAAELCREIGGCAALFGSADERVLCDRIATELREQGHRAHNFAGETSLSEYIELAAACRIYLTNDSGGMHIASALGIPTVAVFGATDESATGPTGDRARVVREPVECSPCLLRECPIDHRCMTRVTGERVAQTALELLK
ncbi:MAG TPA: lipopolysaccharide heptosyltransferase II [Bryobacteraceae bacterium]|nr:lipopolysaccharide heptosyltransferase II [Bryobacteraceae bacterium]